jgi:hypothetical protein
MDAFRRKREDNKRKDLNRKIEALKAEKFADVDMSIAATIEKLADQMGGSRHEAEKIVKKHIDDIFMMMDLER